MQMKHGEEAVHYPVVDTLPPAPYWHVHPARYAAHLGNARSQGRFARVGGDHAMFYFGDSAEVALWETTLRNAQPDEAGRVFVPWEALHGQMISRLHLLEPLSIVDLRPPRRRRFVAVGSELEAWWETLYVTGDYPATHDASRNLLRQYQAQSLAFDGLAWPSRQARRGSAFLTFQPPADPAVWTVQESIALDGAQGLELLTESLWRSGYTFIGGTIGTDLADQ